MLVGRHAIATGCPDVARASRSDGEKIGGE
jgi:hypothetical protein